MDPLKSEVKQAEIHIRFPGGSIQSVILNGDRYVVGREGTEKLRYSSLAGLSREHLAFERQGNAWTVRDLRSTNGTKLNGALITDPQLLQPNDVVTAGPLNIVFTETEADQKDRPATAPVVFVESSRLGEESRRETTLDGLLTGEYSIRNSSHMHALIRAGRELASNMPLEDLFALILNLSVEAVGASRGALMTLEGPQLKVRATKGSGFTISSHVRDQVIQQKRSILVRDALMDQDLAARASIVQQQIRSMLAVPLQTENKLIGLIYLDSPFLIREFTVDDLNTITVMANIAAIRIENTRLAEVEQAEKLHAKELEHAARIQRSMLPSKFPPFPHRTDFALHAQMVPAREVGGDLFDFFLLDEEHLAFAVGDVSGKGAPAALFMAMTRTLLRVTARLQESPGKCFAHMNAILAEQNESSMYVTLFYGVLNTRTGELLFGNAGHNAPYVISREGNLRPLPQKSGPMLGMWENFDYQTFTDHIGQGENILLYTDGVTEATDRNGDFFSEQRMEQCMTANAQATPELLVLNLHAAVKDFAKGAPQADDVTVLSLRYLG